VLPFLRSRTLLLLAIPASSPIGCGYEQVEPPKDVPIFGAAATPAPSLPVEYFADDFALATQSKVFPELSRAAQLGLVRLSSARVVTSAAIGAGGTLSPHAEAFRALLAEARARDAFSELVALSNPHAQLYGLAGLTILDNPAAARWARRLMGNTEEVATMRGCVGGSEGFGRMVSFSEAGKPLVWSASWPKELAGQP
jgi:hypothetical protein